MRLTRLAACGRAIDSLRDFSLTNGTVTMLTMKRPSGRRMIILLAFLAGGIAFTQGFRWWIDRSFEPVATPKAARPIPIPTSSPAAPRKALRPRPTRSPAAMGQSTAALLADRGANAPSPEIVASLEAGMARSGLRLVERERVEEILREQKLSLSGAIDPAVAVRVGGLVGADLLVFVERVTSGSGERGALCRLAVVDSSTGVILDDRATPERDVMQDADSLLVGLEAGAALRAMPAEGRHYVGVLSVRSEVADDSMKALARTLGALLPQDAARVPGVVALDRQRTRHLSQEKQLSDIDQALLPSTSMIVCGVRRQGEHGTLITLQVRRLADGKVMEAQVESPTDDLADVRKRLVECLAGVLSAKGDANLTESEPMDSKAEAQGFAARAEVAAWNGDRAESVRCAEAALALDPSFSTRWQALNMCSNASYRSKETPECLELAARSAELYGELVRAVVHKAPDAVPHRLAGYVMSAGVILIKLPDEVQRQRFRIEALEPMARSMEELAAFHLAEKNTAYYMQATSCSLHTRLKLGDTAALLNGVRRYAADFESIVVQGHLPPNHVVSFDLSAVLFSSTVHREIPFEDRLPVLVWLTEQKNAMVRAAGYGAILDHYIHLWRESRGGPIGGKTPAAPASAAAALMLAAVWALHARRDWGERRTCGVEG